MNKEDFLALDSDAMIAFCQKELDSGKSFEKIQEEIGLKKNELQRIGVVLVKNKFIFFPPQTGHN